MWSRAIGGASDQLAGRHRAGILTRRATEGASVLDEIQEDWHSSMASEGSGRNGLRDGARHGPPRRPVPPSRPATPRKSPRLRTLNEPAARGLTSRAAA